MYVHKLQKSLHLEADYTNIQGGARAGLQL